MLRMDRYSTLGTSWFLANEIRVVKHATFLSSLRGPGGVGKTKKSHQVRIGYLSKITTLRSLSLSTYSLCENTIQEQYGGMINEGSLRNLIFFIELREKGQLEKLKSSWKFFQCWRIQRGFPHSIPFFPFVFTNTPTSHFHPSYFFLWYQFNLWLFLLLSLVYFYHHHIKTKKKNRKTKKLQYNVLS
jgi:hypothetical protein